MLQTMNDIFILAMDVRQKYNFVHIESTLVSVD